MRNTCLAILATAVCALAAVVAPNSSSATHAQSQGVLMEHLSWDEARPLLSADSIVVLPLGAQAKEHGRHLPLNNDWLMAEYFKTRALAAADVVVYPTINYHY